MFKSIILPSAVLLAMMYPHQEAEAQVRCPAGYAGCTYQSVWTEVPQRVNQGAYDVVRNPYSNGRWNEVKTTLKDCWRCGREGLSDGVNRATGSRIGGYTPRRSGRGAR